MKLYFFTSTPATSSKTRIAEQKSSSPHPLAIVARSSFVEASPEGIGRKPFRRRGDEHLEQLRLIFELLLQR